ncbi:MAG: bifunctional riboflavin kinase/FAD synthetase [Planctomycetota bacterium]|nr:MAG: bifunctional riboflavin kinase/FAD synthetase [Planctomycetota bacterium]
MSPAAAISVPEAARDGGVLTVGNFDGVHLGHRQMVDQLVALARKLGTRAIAVTFDPPPLALLAPGRIPPQLTTRSQKVELLKSIGVDEVVVCPTSHELLSLSPEEFFDEILVSRLGCRGIVEGPNFCFGKGRAGDIHMLKELCARQQLPVVIVEAREIDGAMISSSEIRSALSAGDVAKARKWLGRPYTVTGRVIHGAERGRLLGFPTANLGQIETLLPPLGVYACRTKVDRVSYPVALNIGPNPTFAENQLKIEAHLIGFSGDLYGQTVTLEFLQRLRGVVKFEGVDSLKSQLQSDIAETVRCAAE